MCDYRGRTAQREHHAIRKQFTLGRKLIRQTIQNKVKVQFTGNGDVKAWHGLRFIERSVFVQNDNSAQVARIIGIEAFLQSRVETANWPAKTYGASRASSGRSKPSSINRSEDSR